MFHCPHVTLRTFFPFPLSRPFLSNTTFSHSNPTYNSMRRKNTLFPPPCPLLTRHPCDVTQPAQQPEPATLPWREITEIWLIRVGVALVAIL